MPKQTITVKTDEENPQPVEIIAQSIIDISNAFQKINESRLNRRALVLLIRDQTNLGMNEINLVLNIVPKLKDIYLKNVPAKK